MAYLLILTGQRVDDVVELNPTATLTIGSSPEAHIQLSEADVAPIHGQVYPAEGSYWFQDLGHGHTFLNTNPLSNAIGGLSPHDVLIVGRTFLKFVLERPVAVGAAGSGGVETEIERLREELVASQAEAARAAEGERALREELIARGRDIEKLESELAQAAAKTATPLGQEGPTRAEVPGLQAALDAATAQLDEVRPRLERLSDDADRLAAENASLLGELEETRAQVSTLRDAQAGSEAAGGDLERLTAENATLTGELEQARAASDALRTDAERLSTSNETLTGELEEARARLATLRDAQDDMSQLQEENATLTDELERSRAQLAELQGELDAARDEVRSSDVASTVAALDSARAALRALGVTQPASDLPRAEPIDVGALLDAAGMTPEAARSLEASLFRYVEAESTRRFAGAAPRFEPDDETLNIEAQLRELRTSAESLAAALVVDRSTLAES